MALRWVLAFAFGQSVHYAMWLRLVPEEDRARPAAVPVFGTRGGAYSVALVAGRYDVTWAGSGGACGPTGAPCNGASLRAGVMLSSDGVLDLDVRSVHVRGALTLAGAPLPDATAARGALVFAPEGGGAASVAVPRAGAFNYDVVLSPGTYRVAWQGNAALCATAVSPVPCNGATLRAGVSLSADGALVVTCEEVQRHRGEGDEGAAPRGGAGAQRGAEGGGEHPREVRVPRGHERGGEHERDDRGAAVQSLARDEVARVGGEVGNAHREGAQREEPQGCRGGERERDGDRERARERDAQRAVAKPATEPGR